MQRKPYRYSDKRKRRISHRKEELMNLLADLSLIGAATPRQLEIKTNRIGLDVRNQLQLLTKLGYVKKSTYSGGSENEIFTPSDQGYRVLAEQRLSKKNQPYVSAGA